MHMLYLQIFDRLWELAEEGGVRCIEGIPQELDRYRRPFDSVRLREQPEAAMLAPKTAVVIMRFLMTPVQFVAFDGFLMGWHYCRRSSVQRHEHKRRRDREQQALEPTTPKKRRMGDAPQDEEDDEE